MSDPIVSLRNVTKSFGRKEVLNVPILDIKGGTVTALIGPNGAGKSTCIKLIAGLWLPTAADRLHVLGGNQLIKRERRVISPRIGIVGDSSQLYGSLSIHENLEYMALLYGLDKDVRSVNITDSLEACGLAQRSNDTVSTLSTGLKQRANIARALVTRPNLLLLDEPTSGLDPVSVQQVYDVIVRLRQRGLTIIICTHIMQEVNDLCDRVIFLDSGVIVADGTPEELRMSVGDIVFTIPCEDEQVESIRKELDKYGLTRTSIRRLDGKTELSVFGCQDPTIFESLGLNYARRKGELSDAFLLIAGD